MTVPHAPLQSGTPARAGPVRRFERALGARITMHPNRLSALKLMLAIPLSVVLFRAGLGGRGRTAIIALLFAAYATLDYVDGVVARERKLHTVFGRVFDRVAEIPLLFALAWITILVLPAPPLLLKLGLDVFLLLLHARGVAGILHNRLRTTTSYLSLVSLLLLSQGWAPSVVTPEFVTVLLWINAGISLTLVLRRLQILSRSRIADALSISNGACGVMAMIFADRGQLEVSLLMLTLGAALDGMDGAAARRWGGSKLGVYMDDMADGLSYGLAPGFAIYATNRSLDGALVGALFACFVITRLVFFTLNKSGSDPGYFRGVPSPAGGLVAMSSVAMFHGRPLLVGFLVGMACALMVAFDVQHRHLGHALASRRVRAYAIAFVGVLVLSAALGGFRAGVGLVLTTLLIYGFVPSFAAFGRVLAERRKTRRA
ncbi:MAG TPA: CDP-alcohol phosphatidyltransferase family protein [Polyangiaceae bacterium]|nr:CDP-alcohol phosphatidyltransferase family protein [Polyangiaceae bacterium]